MRNLKGIALSGLLWMSILLISAIPTMASNINVYMPTEMDKQEEIKALEKLYKDMYDYMIGKDIISLWKILDEDFVLIHMTGMRQPKKEYLKAISNGTLNYFSCQDSKIITDIQGDKAKFTGKSKVNASVFGGGKHTWRLQLDMDLIKKNGDWKITEIRASTF